MKKVLAAALCGAVMFLLPGCGGERLPYAREMGDMGPDAHHGSGHGGRAERSSSMLRCPAAAGPEACRGRRSAPGPLCGAGVHQQRLPGHAGLSDSYVFYGHVDQLLLGRSCPAGHPGDLQYFSQDQELGMGTQVWIVRGGTAAEAISAEQERGVESRLSTIQTDSEMGMAGMTRTVGETLTSLMEDGSAYLPAGPRGGRRTAGKHGRLSGHAERAHAAGQLYHGLSGKEQHAAGRDESGYAG